MEDSTSKSSKNSVPGSPKQELKRKETGNESKILKKKIRVLKAALKDEQGQRELLAKELER